MSGANWLQLVALVGAVVRDGAAARRVPGARARRRRRARRPVLPAGRARDLSARRASTRAASSRGTCTRSRCSRSAPSRSSALYVLQRVQGVLPLNPTDVDGVPSALAFNTAASFVTNTNWQNYGGRVDDEPPDPDGGAGGAELRLRRGRDRGRRRARARADPAAVGDDRQLLGRPDARSRCASWCRSRP